MKQVAIIGQTASGKSDLALRLAQNTNSYILSIDSLSIYKEIDIASAKPNKIELSQIKHFGIDVLMPYENANVFSFIDEYHKILECAKNDNKNIIIVGGSSFYLKSMIDGLSEVPDFSSETIERTKELLQDVDSAYNLLYSVDKEYMIKISPSDKYRIEKLLLIYLQTNITPSQWFYENRPKPIIKDIDIYNILIDRDILRDKITRRTKQMIDSGLIDEVAYLESKYTRAPNAMKSIGIIETLEYIDGYISKDELSSLISTHTAQLAKRQQTFNMHQFKNIKSADGNYLYDMILAEFGV